MKTTMYKINKLQGYIVQYREYSQYFIITINGIKPLKIVNHYFVHLKHIYMYINYTTHTKNSLKEKEGDSQI